MTDDNTEVRKDLIVQMYVNFWENISRSDDSTWKMVGSYAALIAAISFVYDKIGQNAAGILLMSFSFVGLWHTINQNQWFIRNMGLISNIERRFLREEDFREILDIRWRNGVRIPFFNTNTHSILCIFFVIMILFSLGLSVGFVSTDCAILATSFAIFGLFSLFTILFMLHFYKRYEDFKEHAKGPRL